MQDSLMLRRVLSSVLALWWVAGSVLAQNAPPNPPPAAPDPPLTSLTAEQRKEILDGIGAVLKDRAFVPNVDFSNWNAVVAERESALNASDTVQAFVNNVNGLFRSYGISHIRFMNPVATANYGRTSTIGVGIGAAVHREGLIVRSVFPGSPGATAGIGEGDIILKVNGEKPENAEALSGAEGDQLIIDYRHGEDLHSVTVTVATFSTVRPEPLTWPTEDIAMIRVYTFSNGYGRENLERIIKEAAKAKALIIDVRRNGGGAANNLNHLLSILLPDQTVYGTFLSRRIVDQYREAHDNPDSVDLIEVAKWTEAKTRTRARGIDPFTGPIAVLTDRGSGSASEIFAASMRENANAVIVGQPTAGAVLASIRARLPYGFSMQFPISDFITANGVRLEKAPVQPDVLVPSGENDAVMLAATTRLRSMIEARATGSGGQ
ncbi:MAG: PDZ domain-containing protein [Fimbriimonadaceae bacterium]|nr:PDZ domain-containing protein [Fimbriimonadaceae bacterium]